MWFLNFKTGWDQEELKDETMSAQISIMWNVRRRFCLLSHDSLNAFRKGIHIQTWSREQLVVAYPVGPMTYVNYPPDLSSRWVPRLDMSQNSILKSNSSACSLWWWCLAPGVTWCQNTICCSSGSKPLPKNISPFVHAWHHPLIFMMRMTTMFILDIFPQRFWDPSIIIFNLEWFHLSLSLSLFLFVSSSCFSFRCLRFLGKELDLSIHSLFLMMIQCKFLRGEDLVFY